MAWRVWRDDEQLFWQVCASLSTLVAHRGSNRFLPIARRRFSEDPRCLDISECGAGED